MKFKTFAVLFLGLSLTAASVKGQAKPETRYVICEAYPPAIAVKPVESMTNPLFKNLAYSSGCNYPTWYLPDYVRLSQDPMAFARYDIQMAKAAGIDAFCFGDTAYGYQSQFAEVFWDYWKAAKEDGSFKFVPYTLMLNRESGNAVRWDHFLHAWDLLIKDYRNTFLTIDGKYAVLSYSDDPLKASLASSQDIGPLLASLGGTNKTFLIQQTTYLASLTPIAGFDGGQYNGPVVTRFKASIKKYATAMTEFQLDSYGDVPPFQRGLENVAKELGKEVVYPVMQSFFQSRWQFAASTWPGGRIREKLGFAACYWEWRHAIDSHARIVYITTWNDVTEDHSVMPEELHGYAYYELTKYFIKWFKSGARPPVEKEQILLFHHPQLTEKPLRVPPGALVVGRYNNSSTPPTDYIGVVVMLKNPAKVTVDLGVSSTGIPNIQLASRDFPAGTNFWLIYHPLANGGQSGVPDMDANKSYSKDEHPVYPEEWDDFFITKLDHGFEDREVFVSVDRGDKNVGYFTSHVPIVGAAAAGNLGTVGDVFDLEQNNQ